MFLDAIVLLEMIHLHPRACVASLNAFVVKFSMLLFSIFPLHECRLNCFWAGTGRWLLRLSSDGLNRKERFLSLSRQIFEMSSSISQDDQQQRRKLPGGNSIASRFDDTRNDETDLYAAISSTQNILDVCIYNGCDNLITIIHTSLPIATLLCTSLQSTTSLGHMVAQWVCIRSSQISCSVHKSDLFEMSHCQNVSDPSFPPDLLGFGAIHDVTYDIDVAELCRCPGADTTKVFGIK